MKKLITTFNTEPVVVLACVAGLVSVLAEQHIIPTWIPLAVLAVVTPIQRQLVTPESKLKKIGAAVRKELNL